MKKYKKTCLKTKTIDWSANGVRSTHLLVQIHNNPWIKKATTVSIEVCFDLGQWYSGGTDTCVGKLHAKNNLEFLTILKIHHIILKNSKLFFAYIFPANIISVMGVIKSVSSTAGRLHFSTGQHQPLQFFMLLMLTTSLFKL